MGREGSITMTQGTMKYSENGFWIQKEGDLYVIGLSEKGQDDLGEVVFIDLPKLGGLKKDEVLIGVEAAKAVTELTMPVSGEIVEVRSELEDSPELLNNPEPSNTWIIKVKNVDEAEVAQLADESGV